MSIAKSIIGKSSHISVGLAFITTASFVNSLLGAMIMRKRTELSSPKTSTDILDNVHSVLCMVSIISYASLLRYGRSGYAFAATANTLALLSTVPGARASVSSSFLNAYGTSGLDEAYTVSQTSDGGFFLAGYSQYEVCSLSLTVLGSAFGKYG